MLYVVVGLGWEFSQHFLWFKHAALQALKRHTRRVKHVTFFLFFFCLRVWDVRRKTAAGAASVQTSPCRSVEASNRTEMLNCSWGQLRGHHTNVTVLAQHRKEGCRFPQVFPLLWNQQNAPDVTFQHPFHGLSDLWGQFLKLHVDVTFMSATRDFNYSLMRPARKFDKENIPQFCNQNRLFQCG